MLPAHMTIPMPNLAAIVPAVQRRLHPTTTNASANARKAIT
jgi:hypothetical protein